MKKANLGLYVIRDLNIEFEDLKAQIDYVVVTPMYCYFIECKNLIGNITVNEKGDFIREYEYNGKKNKTGMYSPLRQVEAQRDVYKKIWNTHLSTSGFWNSIKRFLGENNFKDTHRVLVVAANNETIINTKYAPKDIKDIVIKSDSLIRKITDDLNKSDKDLLDNQKNQELWAKHFLNLNKEYNIDYYEYYKNKYRLSEQELKTSDISLKEKLIEFRKSRSERLNMPPYFIFNNDELDKIIKLKPRSSEELTNSGILPEIKIKTHGIAIIEEINKYI